MASENITILIQSKGHNRIVQRFRAIGDAATDAQTKVKGLGTDISGLGKRSGSGVKKVESSVKKLDKTVTRTKKNAKGMWTSFAVPSGVEKGIKRLAGLFIGFQAVGVLKETADEFIRMGNTLKGFGTAAEDVGRVRKEINALSKDARVNAVETATLYGRLRLATRDFGTSQKEVLKVTGTVSKALRLSGSSGLEASQSIRQLSQAFNKGKLDGDEFRSVMENAPIIQKLLSRQLGVTKQSLFDMAQAGKITAKELTAAFTEGADEIEKAFNKLDKTLGDYITNFQTDFREAFGAKATGSVKVLGEALELLGRNIGRVLDILIKLAGLKAFSLMASGIALATARLRVLSRVFRIGGLSALFGLSPIGKGKGVGGAATVGASAMMMGHRTGFQAPAPPVPAASMGRQVAGGAMMLGRGLGKAIPYAGMALIAYELLDAMGLFGKSAEEMADAARNAAEEMVAAKAKFLPIQKADRPYALTEATPEPFLGMAKESRPDLVRGLKATKSSTAPGIMGTTRNVTIPDTAAIAKAEGELLDLAATYAALAQQGRLEGGLISAPIELLRLEIENAIPDLDEMLKLTDDFIQKTTGMGDIPGRRAGPKMFEFLKGRFPGKEADLEFVKKGFNAETGKPTKELLAQLIPLWRNYGEALPLTDQEKLGNSMEKTAASIVNYQKRLEDLQNVNILFSGKEEDRARAIRSTQEEIDKLSGGLKTLEDVTNQTTKNMNSALRKLSYDGVTTDLNFTAEELSKIEEAGLFGKIADMAASLKVSVPFRDRASQIASQVRATLAAIDGEKSLLATILKTVDAYRQAAQAAKDRTQTLKDMRQAAMDVGKTQAALNKEAFTRPVNAEDPGATPDQIKEFEAYETIRGRSSVELDVKRITKEYVDAVKLFSQEAAKIQKDVIPTATAEQAKSINEDLQKDFNELKGIGAKLGETLGREVGPASEPFVAQMETALKDAATTIGFEAGRSLGAAFKEGLLSAIPGLQALAKDPAGPPSETATFPARPGSTGPPSLATEEEIQRGRDLKSAYDNLARSATTIGQNARATRQELSALGSAGLPALNNLSRSAENSANEIQGFFESAFGSLEDALVSFVTTGEFDFKKLMNAILADLARLIVRMLIIKPLMSLLGGFFGFAQGGRIPAFASGGKIPKYATGGGMIGGYGGSTSDRYAAMVSPGEAVIRSSQVRRNRGIVGELLGGKKVKKKTAGGGGAVAVTYAPVINVTGGSDDGGEQQGQEIQAVIEKGFMEMLTREMRPNGALEGASRRSFS